MPFIELNNMLWGSPNNPWNKSRVCGTSSEASLVVLKLVNFAISEDIIGE